MAELIVQIVISGLTLGSMYALSAVGLSLVWGALGMLNMAHGALIALGGYACFGVIAELGLPTALGLPVAMLCSGLFGILVYLIMIRFIYRQPAFETNIIIATIGLAILFENVIQQVFGAYPYPQPLTFPGGSYIGEIFLPNKNLAILGVSVFMFVLVALLLGRTRLGRAIRAVAINREAAQLMGVPIERVFALVMGLAGVLAAVSGVMLSTITSLAPTMGYDPMVKAFIICATAGLGNVYGAFIAAISLGLFEAVVQYLAGVRFAFPAMLVLVIVALIWRPYGVFGRRRVMRV